VVKIQQTRRFLQGEKFQSSFSIPPECDNCEPCSDTGCVCSVEALAMPGPPLAAAGPSPSISRRRRRPTCPFLLSSSSLAEPSLTTKPQIPCLEVPSATSGCLQVPLPAPTRLSTSALSRGGPLHSSDSQTAFVRQSSDPRDCLNHVPARRGPGFQGSPGQSGAGAGSFYPGQRSGRVVGKQPGLALQNRRLTDLERRTRHSLAGCCS
jgi:hypothetical protein